MNINEEVKERLMEVITDNSTNKSKFAKSLGLQPSLITDIFSGKAKTISGNILVILQLRYGINHVWLETGSGSKFISQVELLDNDEIELIYYLRTFNKDSKTLLKIIVDTLLKSQEERQAQKKEEDDEDEDEIGI